MVKVSHGDLKVKNSSHGNSGDLKLPRLVLRETKVKRRLLHPVPDSVKLAQLRQFLRQGPEVKNGEVREEEPTGNIIKDITSKVRLLRFPDVAPDDSLLRIEKLTTAFAMCETNQDAVHAETEGEILPQSTAIGSHQPDLFCTCNVCEAFISKSPKLTRKPLEKVITSQTK